MAVHETRIAIGKPKDVNLRMSAAFVCVTAAGVLRPYRRYCPDERWS